MCIGGRHRGIAVLGTGLIGRMIVRELAQSSVWSEVLAVDGSTAAAEAAVNEAMQAASQSTTTGWPAVRSVATDLGSFDKMVDFLRDVDIAIRRCPFAQLRRQSGGGGGRLPSHRLGRCTISGKKSALDTPAREADVLVVTGCGLAPGIANVLAARGVRNCSTRTPTEPSSRTYCLRSGADDLTATAEAVLGVARVYQSMTNWAKLETALERLVKLLPNEAESWYDLASLKAILGKAPD